MDTNSSPPASPLPAAAESAAIRAGRNSRFGLKLFAIYVVLYGSFVGLNTFAPQSMAHPVLRGMNLAIVYGLFLIIVAFVLAMIYAVFCREIAGEGGAK